MVGSGAGGGPVAARLARLGHRVLLLEAGRDVGGKLAYQVPAYHALSTEAEDSAWWFFVDHNADDALEQENPKRTDAGVLYPRGSALGGSTAVNAMVTVLPPPSDWDRLATLTRDPGFRATEMRRYFDRVKEWLPTEVADPALAANDGLVTNFLLSAASYFADESDVDLFANPNDLSGSIGELARLFGADLNDHLEVAETTGLFRLPTATKEGVRHGTREWILETIDAGYPLTLRTSTFVTKVLFDENADVKTAIGVEYVEGDNLYQASLGAPTTPSARMQVRATREVILSAGTFNSPQLLMQSGVGDPEHLTAVGIRPEVASSNVGLNLQDRYEISVVTELDRPLSLVGDCDLSHVATEGPCVDEWEEHRGALTTNGFLASLLMRSDHEEPLADLQVFASPSDARGYFPGYSTAAVADQNHFSWLLLKAHTHNHDGSVRLASDNPLARPIIQFRSYDEDNPAEDPDLTALVRGVRHVRGMLERAQARVPDVAMTESLPGRTVESDEALRHYIRTNSWGHHACCTNAMGPDDDDVLDSRFRVRGTERLRVVDASVFPEIPGTFIALPIFMVSERAADVIHEDALAHDANKAMAFGFGGTP